MVQCHAEQTHKVQGMLEADTKWHMYCTCGWRKATYEVGLVAKFAQEHLALEATVHVRLDYQRAVETNTPSGITMHVSPHPLRGMAFDLVQP